MSGANNNVILRFDNVSFHYGEDNKKKVILDEADFSIRENTKITIMGQNGAWKSTIFKMILGELTPQSGKINISQGTKIAPMEQ